MFSGDDISVEDAAKLYSEAYHGAAVGTDNARDSRIEEAALYLGCGYEDVANFVRDFKFYSAESAEHLKNAKCGKNCSCLRDMYINHTDEYLAVRERVYELTDGAKSVSFVPKRKVASSYKKFGAVGISTKETSSSSSAAAPAALSTLGKRSRTKERDDDYNIRIAISLKRQYNLCMVGEPCS